ncbi:metallophosphoesterase [Brevibacillus sp. SYSU BS000544]|uniref:metallophosphoesterase n=1 Tax=Brevibacillus sp. SYSU BS000544 TaxID=3416443 RepID=UPI003CE53CCF
MKPRVWAVLTGVLLIYSLIVFFIGWNGYVWLRTLVDVHAGYYSVIMAILAYSYFLGRVNYRLSIFKVIGSYWFAAVQFALILLPLADLSVLLASAVGIPLESAVFWTGAVVLAIFIFAFLLGSWNAWSPIVRTYQISIPKPAGKYRSLRIGMASDLHLGTLVGNVHLHRLVTQINALGPDLILLPGDVIDDDIEPFIRKNMGEVMKHLQAPLGVYAVLGNHEYIGKKIPEYVKEMTAINIRVLMDEIVTLADSITLIGRKDRAARQRQSLEQLVAGVDPAHPIFVMDHQPYELKQAALHGVDLMLSGHTHRGQIVPNHLITRRIFELDWGYLQKEQLHAIVSSGFGTWGPPLRLGSRSEIIQIDITFTG